MTDILDGTVTSEALAWPARARTLTIRDDATYTSAGAALVTIKDQRQQIADAYGPHIKRAHEAHKALLADQKAAEAPLVEAETILKAALSTYERAQEAERRAEQQRLEAAARQAEETRRLAEAAALEREATATNDPTLREEAQRVLDAPLVVSGAVMAPTTTPKLAGVSYRSKWSARVVSLQALVTWVSAHPDHLHLLDANQGAIDGLARAMKAHLRIPGLEAVETPVVAVRR